MTPSPATVAHAYVQLILRLTGRMRRLHLCVQTKSRRAPPSVRYDWQNGCLFGVSFRRRDAIEAEAWITEAITAGCRPLYSFRKRGSGYCPNDISKLLEAA